MDAHRSRSLGMAALIFILISLTAAVFHGAAPVRAEDATTTPTPVAIDENTARVTVKLYTDEYRTQELKRCRGLCINPLRGFFGKFQDWRGSYAWEQCCRLQVS